MELEAARFKTQQELRLKDDQLSQLKHLLNNAIHERDEAQNRYQTLLLQYHHNHHQTTTPPPPPPHSAISSIEDEPITNAGFSSSDCEESIVSSPITELTPPPRSSEQELPFPVVPLPEKGKLLEAVIKAGPLLQNLLLAGPLPHWRHPPPPLDTYQIPPPPVVLPSPPSLHHLVWKFNKKRGSPEGSDSSTETKYQRIAIN
ncbi:proline-rich receptor-like protein kinase PERK9 [Cynara cardunculus var. scolymus]|uniref:proline-rich receptor-like protein kinase PERK9 n=1 Tax=Cynara cardunculus var. scolymus TaxID=59895 RepID=UPI000D626970|nr:proline-rich receptor-like protein kinase PERK9 [Cynara cardunculus var. scolymus]